MLQWEPWRIATTAQFTQLLLRLLLFLREPCNKSLITPNSCIQNVKPEDGPTKVLITTQSEFKNVLNHLFALHVDTICEEHATGNNNDAARTA